MNGWWKRGGGGEWVDELDVLAAVVQRGIRLGNGVYAACSAVWC